ncbi:Hint domain-containing protein [Dehalogenimonas etheniformans]|uniref:Hint domain-containing protein n=1 Tax=Dehalogenimonas etheniformans TaxID=1536648 RepID=UPI000C81A2C7|nr:Hint domain-containing protein [Dehalogenimonas etheniformans]QNT76418.1 Hint domain-containing protein [Dehalogenimonas etheniformans]
MVLKTLLLATVFFITISAGFSCAGSSPTTTSTPPLTEFVLRYRLLDAYPNYFWCDPDFYPIGNPDGELANALAQFDSIKSNDQEFTAIINRIGLDRKTDYTQEEKLLVYRQHKLLNKVTLEFQAISNGFTFVIRVGENQGQKITGTISNIGKIDVTKTEPSFNTCPICLSKGTAIDTPNGPVPVNQLSAGDVIWTVGENGERISAPIVNTTMTAEPSVFELMQIALADGRSVTASSRHPTSDGRLLGNLKLGESLDGSAIVSIEIVSYEGRTYDILPEGPSGTYWANGILLASTIVDPNCGS